MPPSRSSPRSAGRREPEGDCRPGGILPASKSADGRLLRSRRWTSSAAPKAHTDVWSIGAGSDGSLRPRQDFTSRRDDTALTVDSKRSLLLFVDFQSRLMPAIDGGATAIRNTNRLIEMAKLVDVPHLFSEQNADRSSRDALLSNYGCHPPLRRHSL